MKWNRKSLSCWIACLSLWLWHATVLAYCDPGAPRSLDGRCNNLRHPERGAVDAPFLFQLGQHYARGGHRSLYFMRERALAPGEDNHYPFFPTPEAAEGTCGPQGYDPECAFTIDAVEIAGLGPKSPFNPRVLSNVLHDLESPLAPEGVRLNDAGLTNLFIRFSQLVAHDLQLLEPSVRPNRRRHGLANQSDPSNPTVLSGVPVLEPFDLFNVVSVFTPRGVPELPQFRSIIVTGPVPRIALFGHKRRLVFPNAFTSYIDGDTFYGRSQAVLDVLRAHEGGKLLLTSLTSPQVGPIPPLAIEGFPPSFSETGLRDEAEIDGMESFTPTLADSRNLSTIGTTALHVLWLRFHNLQAEHCRERHPWLDPFDPADDDALFDCARRRTLAIYQHIVFDEFVPAMTGRPLPRYRVYRSWINPQASIEMVLGAFSLHSTPGELSAIAQPDGTVDERLQVMLPGQPDPPPGYFPFIGSLFPTEAASAAFYLALSGIPTPLGNPSDPNTPWILAEDPLAQQIRGLAFFAHEANDLTVIDSQRNIPANYGFDLVANNTFRNQVLGAGNYFQARRRFLHGPQGRIYGREGCPQRFRWRDDLDDPLECFALITGDLETAKLVQEQLRAPLLGVRAKVKHLPLFTGVLMEPTLEGSIFGPTGRALIEDQFRRSRDGDRFYYRNQFSAEEVDEIETYFMADVIRAVLGDGVGVQDDVFRVPPDGFFER